MEGGRGGILYYDRVEKQSYNRVLITIQAVGAIAPVTYNGDDGDRSCYITR